MRHPRTFSLLVCTQFLTVLNDSLFKQTVLLLAIGAVGSIHAQALASATFSIPFVLFAVIAGDCADRYSKRDQVVWCKFAEMVVMLLAAAALYSGDFPLLLGVVFLMGMQSAFLGPAKYGLLPELASAQGLPRANGILQASVLAAILLGTGSAGHVALDDRRGLAWVAVGMALLAGVGLLLALRMARLPAAKPDRSIRWDPLRRLVQGMRDAGRYPGLRASMLGHAVFWLTGSWLLLAWNEFLSKDEDGVAAITVDPGTWSLGLACLSLFMAIGAIAAGFCLRRGLPRWMPLASAVGMAIGFLAAGLLEPDAWTLFLCLGAASFFSGGYLIPLRSLMQKLPKHSEVGATLGTAQMLDFLLITIAALCRRPLADWGVDAQRLLLSCAVLMILAAVGMRCWLPRTTPLNDDGK